MKRSSWMLVLPAVLGVSALRASSGPAAEPGMPAAARAALVVRPALVTAQPAVTHALGLQWVLRAFRSYAALGDHGERFTVMVVDTDASKETVGLARGKTDVGKVFESLRGERAETIGAHTTYRMQQSPDRIARMGTQEIVEGSAAALRRVLAPTPVTPQRSALERTLLGASAAPGAATLLYLSDGQEASLAEMLRDFDAIWHGLARLIAPYETAMSLLGDMRGGRADVWQDSDSVRVRVLFVATGDLDAKRALMALRTARQLAPLASDAAVHAGSLTQKDADLVRRVLESMRTSAEDERVRVDLAVDAATVLPGR